MNALIVSKVSAYLNDMWRYVDLHTTIEDPEGERAVSFYRVSNQELKIQQYAIVVYGTEATIIYNAFSSKTIK